MGELVRAMGAGMVSAHLVESDVAADFADLDGATDETGITGPEFAGAVADGVENCPQN